jgi:hypothetical protein
LFGTPISGFRQQTSGLAHVGGPFNGTLLLQEVLS